jgi:hypothetical protein
VYYIIGRVGLVVFALLSALCSLLSALCSLLSALCSLLSALCSLLSISLSIEEETRKVLKHTIIIPYYLVRS